MLNLSVVRGGETMAKTVRRGSPEALDLQQTSADADQSRADADQTLSDADQALSGGDQAQADRDQLASDHDQAAADREHAAQRHPSAAEQGAYKASQEQRAMESTERVAGRLQRDLGWIAGAGLPEQLRGELRRDRVRHRVRLVPHPVLSEPASRSRDGLDVPDDSARLTRLLSLHGRVISVRRASL